MTIGNRRRYSPAVTGRPGNRPVGAVDAAMQRASSIAAVRVGLVSDTSLQETSLQSLSDSVDTLSAAVPDGLQTTLDGQQAAIDDHSDTLADHESRIAALESP